jgi:hypothetical protein
MAMPVRSKHAVASTLAEYTGHGCDLFLEHLVEIRDD